MVIDMIKKYCAYNTMLYHEEKGWYYKIFHVAHGNIFDNRFSRTILKRRLSFLKEYMLNNYEG